MEIFHSALALSTALRSGQITPREVMVETKQRLDHWNPAINGLIWLQDDVQLNQEIKHFETLLSQSTQYDYPFCGVPLPIKDLTDVKDWPNTMGSVACRDNVSSADSLVVSLLRKAGCWLWGRSNSAEFGTLPVTENTLYGATRNPWDLQRSAGGSSGGAGALVAAGVFTAAHGSDGGGSIRIPASCCHLVGLKPSRGRVPKGPMLSDVLHGFATDGILTRTISDAAAFLDVMTYADPQSWYAAPPAGSFSQKLNHDRRSPLKIGWTTKGPLSHPTCDASRQAVIKTATLLQDLGHFVEEVDLSWPMRETIGDDFIKIWRTGSAYVPAIDWSLTETLNQNLREQAMQQNSLDYMKAIMRLQMFSRQVVAWWGTKFDLLVLPTIAIEPPPIGWLYATGLTDPDELLRRAAAMAPFTGWVNVTGQPAISLPTYFAGQLPIGVQLVAPPFREDLLLGIGKELEDALGWHRHFPI